MGETSKARERREREGWFDKFAPPDRPGIDIGSGPDPLNDTFRRWDKPDGDAALMAGVAGGTFATVYASHVLEHLNDPLEALRNWWRILATGGHLIVLVPHRDLYEKRLTLPSRWNGEHKTFWLPDDFDPPVTWSFRWAIERAVPDGELVLFQVLDECYQANGNDHAGGEYSIEAIVRKS
jgi:SAM-dependent methyltransferase